MSQGCAADDVRNVVLTGASHRWSLSTVPSAELLATPMTQAGLQTQSLSNITMPAFPIHTAMGAMNPMLASSASAFAHGFPATLSALPHVQVQAHARAQSQPESQQLQQQCSVRSESHTASGAAGSAASGSRGGGSGTDTSICKTSHQRKRRKRKQLDAETVVRMFLSRNDAERWTGSLSNTLAAEHGLTAQAIRDIWNLRTWRK